MYLLLNDLTRQIPFAEWDFNRDPEAIDMDTVDLDAFVEAVLAHLAAEDSPPAPQ